MLSLATTVIAALSLFQSSVSAAPPSVCPSLPNPLPNVTGLTSIPDLPNPWTFFDGRPLHSSADWACRKQELLTLVQEYFYGYYPDHSKEIVRAERSGPFNETVLSISVTAGGRTGSFSANLTFPVGASALHPVPMVINTGGVDTTVFMGSGVALATFDPDSVANDSATPSGAFWDVYPGEDIGVLTAWAWGYHRVLDAIVEKVPEIDPLRIGVTGCSRWGKAALAAGIFDERVFLSIPMSSGLEGVGPWRFFFEQYGANEMIANITGYAPWWSTSRLEQFVPNVTNLPFDAHLEAALVAPRALIWDEGTIDYWTNPEGTASVTYVATQAIYKWLGVGDNVGISLRDSGHCDISGYANMEAFMNKAFFGEKTSRNYSDISPYTPYTEAFPWINDAP